MKKISDLFDINNILNDYLEEYMYPCNVLPNINKIIMDMARNLDMNEYQEIAKDVFIHNSVKLGQGVEIIPPAIIMENTNLRHNAYLRGNVIIGPNSVVGNSLIII